MTPKQHLEDIIAEGEHHDIKRLRGALTRRVTFGPEYDQIPNFARIRVGLDQADRVRFKARVRHADGSVLELSPDPNGRIALKAGMVFCEPLPPVVEVA